MGKGGENVCVAKRGYRFVVFNSFWQKYQGGGIKSAAHMVTPDGGVHFGRNIDDFGRLKSRLERAAELRRLFFSSDEEAAFVAGRLRNISAVGQQASLANQDEGVEKFFHRVGFDRFETGGDCFGSCWAFVVLKRLANSRDLFG